MCNRAAVTVLVMLGLAAMLTAVGRGAGVAEAAGPATETCGYATAGTGTYARSLCWFDLSHYDAALAGSPGGQPITVSLPGGYTITFTLNTTGGPVHPSPLPTYSGAYLGNNGHYTGVAGKPALDQSKSGTTSKATLSDIIVVNAKGKQVSGYSFIGADAEATDDRESITWTSDSPLDLISSIGNACDSGAGLTGTGTTTVKCASSQSGTKTGTAILAALHPTTISQTMVGAGQQAVAFGVLVSTVQLSKVVASRVNPTDSFRISVISPNGSVLGSADTGTGDTATTGEINALNSATGDTGLLTETATSGMLSNYDISWSCNRNGKPDAALPSGPGGRGATVSLAVGDAVDCTITNTAKTSSLSLVKQVSAVNDVNGDGLTDAGDTITYTYTVTNTGELTLHGIAVSDSKVGTVTCSPDTLSFGETATCTAGHPYTVTTADENAGVVNNTATASGLPPGSTVPVDSPPSSTSTPAESPRPMVSLTKIARAASGDIGSLVVGETITYTYLVFNTGNDNLTSITVTDSKLGPVTCPTPPSPGLAPGHAVKCTATYTVTQADVDAGHVVNTATATGTDTDGNTSPDSQDSVDTGTVTPAPTVAIEKTATVSPSADQGGVKVGDTIAYSYVVTNTGNVDLPSVAVSDPNGGPVTCPVPPAPGLAPGDSVTCTATTAHTVTQADFEAGSVIDTATATGTDTNGTVSPPSDPSTAVVPAAPPVRRVSLTKSGTVTPAADQNALKVGDTVQYSYVVTNTGNVYLATVRVFDPVVGHVTCPVPPAPGLAPGAPETCTADKPYTVTQADVDAGHVLDKSIADGSAQLSGGKSQPTVPSPIATDDIPAVAPAPSVSVVKHATVTPIDDQNAAKAGDTITYTYTVTNTGNVDLASVAVSDPKAGAVTCQTVPAPGLAPAGMLTCTATTPYTVTSDDVSAGQVADTATATGTDNPGNTSPPSDPSDAIVPTEPAAPAVSVRKIATVSPASDQQAARLGDTITYSYVVTNTGNVNLASVAVTDPAAGHVTCPALAPPGLEPGGHVVCTASTVHTVTDADAKAGYVADTATATGTDSQGNTSHSSAPSTAVVNVLPAMIIPTDLGRWTPDDHTGMRVASGLSGLAAAAALLAWRRRRMRA
jgi:uncharacterized repeat protein (TIGR01451 family)